MRIGTLFSGIGSPEQACKRVFNDDFKLVFACEWDKYARLSFNANYKIEEEHFHKDINDMNGLKYRDKVDIIIGGSPCQDFSLAGLRAGIDGQKGILIYQYIRIIKEVNPPYFIYENVKGMLSDKNGKTLKDFLDAFREMGYFCHYEVLNTKDYGVPQNRERIFIVGFLYPNEYYRFQFAPKIPLEKRLKDILEDDVDEKYYLSDKILKGFVSGKSVFRDRFEIRDTNKYASCLDTREGSRRTNNFIKAPILKQIGTISKTITKRINEVPIELNKFLKYNKRNFTINQLADLTGIKKTSLEHYFRTDKSRATPSQDDWNKLKEVLKFDDTFDYIINEIISKESIFESTSRVYTDDIAPTLTCSDSSLHLTSHRIRKLTPLECFRLQDFPDTFKFVVSDTQLYKQAGNSISVNVMEMILRQLKKVIDNETISDRLF